MSKNNFNLKKIWNRWTDRDLSKAEFNPYRDWKFILAGAFAGLILVVISSVTVFLSVRLAMPDEEISNEPSAVSLNKNGLEKMIQFYQTKSERFDSLASDRETEFQKVSDPSL